MAQLTAVIPPVLVIDTSYLTELYQVPDYFDPEHHKKVRAKFEAAVAARSRLYVPFPVVFEVANHIVDGREARVQIAARFVDDVLKSYELGRPFVITPALDEEHLKELLRIFAREFASERIGLTDGTLVEEARRLKKKYGAQARVHIWTKDRRLKAREPDKEVDPFVG